MPLIEQSARGGTPYSFAEHQRERGELFAKSPSPSAGTRAGSSRTITSRPTRYGASSGSLSSRSGSGT